MKLFIATPCHRGTKEMLDEIHRWTTYTVEVLKLKDPQLGVVSNCPWLDCARADLVSAFMGTQCTHLLFRDDDVYFEPSILQGLIDMQTPIAIAPYVTAVGDPQWTVVLEPGGRIAYAGLGAALIQRQVFDNIAIRNPDLRYTQGGEQRIGYFMHQIVTAGGVRIMLKEDHAFYRRAYEAGYYPKALEGARIMHGGRTEEWHAPDTHTPEV